MALGPPVWVATLADSKFGHAVGRTRYARRSFEACRAEVHSSIQWAKLAALAEAARIASGALWGKSIA
jgi:hypothetical protein